MFFLTVFSCFVDIFWQFQLFLKVHTAFFPYSFDSGGSYFMYHRWPLKSQIQAVLQASYFHLVRGFITDFITDLFTEFFLSVKIRSPAMLKFTSFTFLFTIVQHLDFIALSFILFQIIISCNLFNTLFPLPIPLARTVILFMNAFNCGSSPHFYICSL